MVNDHDTTTGAAPTSQPGPDVLEERTLTGIFVHLLGLFTSFTGPLLIYAVSEHDFTRRNARNAMNWQLFYMGALLAAIILFGATVIADIVLPDMIIAAMFLVVFAFFFGVTIIGFLNVIFPLVASGKAIFGKSWEYPFAPDFVSFDRTSIAGGINVDWWKLIGLYVVTAPVLFGEVFWSAFVDEPDSGVWFGVFFTTLLFVLVASLFTLVFLYRDIEIVTATTTWTPSSIPYLGVPVGSGIVTYLAAVYAFNSANPSGDAVYGYMGGLWVVCVIYLSQRHRYLGRP